MAYVSSMIMRIIMIARMTDRSIVSALHQNKCFATTFCNKDKDIIEMLTVA